MLDFENRECTRKRWMDSVKEDSYQLLQCKNCQRIALDRQDWRSRNQEGSGLPWAVMPLEEEHNIVPRQRKMSARVT